LLERALGVQGTTIALEARGAQISQEKQEIEATILRLKQLQGRASEDELKVLLKQIQNLKIASKEISNALPPTQKSSTTDKTPFLEKLTGSPRTSAAISEGLIGGAFPLLFGQGLGASVLGAAGGAAGGFAGGGLGFGLSLIGTAIGTAVDEADALDKQLTKVNASAKGAGNTSADVKKLASSLGIAKEEAVTLLAQFKQFGSAQIRKDLALVFGGGREAILERLESIVREEDTLQAIAAARKEIGNQEATSLLNTFKIEGSARAQLVLREALLRISEKEVIEEKKRITLLDRAAQFNPFSILLSGPDLTKPVDPAVFGEKRAADQQKIFDKERDQRRKNYDTAIKDSQKFFKLFDEQSGSGKSSGEALGANLLSAIDTRNEAIDNARKQREQQIADIRKQAVEAAARIEEDLADKRKQIEREIQDVRRSRADSAIDADLRFRELRGEDPGVIEAERELLAISREDRDARIELQRRLGDEEEAQAKVIAEFEKGVAKQIQDANLAGARAIGEIQSNYAKQVAKIVEEGSDKAGKRLVKAAEMVNLYIQRGTQNNMIAGATGFVIPERTNGAYNFGAQGSRSKEQLKQDPTFEGLPTSIDNLFRIDDKLDQLKKDLNMSRRPDIGQQFTALLGAEGGYEDVAGLKPLPLQKMLQQIGRPFTQLYKQLQSDLEAGYANTRQEIKKILAPSPKRTEAVLKRAAVVETVKQNWKPENAEWKERMNRWNPAPRSAPAGASRETYEAITRQLGGNASQRANSAGGGWVREYSSFLTPGEIEVLRKGIQDQLRQGAQPLDVEYGASMDIRKAVQGILEEQGLPSHKWSPRGPSPMFMRDEGPLQDRRDPWVERFMQQTEPIQIVPGVQNRIEGASLPGGAFDVSKAAADFGQVASASFISGLLAQNSGAPGAQIAQAYNVKKGDRVGEYPPQPRKATTPSISGAAAVTTQARKDLGAETLAALDDKKFANLKNYFAEINAEGLAVSKNLIEQNRLLDAQLVLMGSGVESGLARQLAEIDDAYADRLGQLEGKRNKALKDGYDVSVVEGFYKAELDLLDETTDKIRNRTIEYAKQSEFLLAIASLEQQIAVTGAAEQAGFFGAGASAYTGELARSGDPGQATEIAQQTRALEVQQAVAGIRGELNSLTDSTNIAITAANGVGVAFAQSFQGLIDGSMSAKEALGSFFKSVADMFLEMAAQIIAKQITMIILQTILKALGATAGASGGGGGGGASSGPGIDPGAFNIGPAGQVPGLVQAANGATFSNGLAQFANGGAFTNSIVSSPTLFKFANGGTTQMGEMGEAGPEAIMPLSRGAGGRLGVDASGLREAMDRQQGGSSGSPVLNMSFQSTSINGVEYVSRDQLESAMAETRRNATRDGAKRGMTMTLDRIQNSSSTRRKVGI
jgi:hypothetical protein